MDLSGDQALVLVWQKNPRPPVVHVDGGCPTLSRSSIPDRSVPFGGRGSAGWVPRREARRRNFALCSRCTWPD